MEEEIKSVIEILNSGGIILYPTDTIWGIGCDATNEVAVEKIYQLKKRSESKSMLLLLDNVNFLERYVDDVPEIAYDLISLTEKPMTVIYSGAKNIAKNLIAEDGSIGIRITDEAFSKKLIQRFKKPLVSTSANIHGEPFPAFFNEITNEIKSAVDYIVKWRQDDITPGQPSSIIKLGADCQIKIIRE